MSVVSKKCFFLSQFLDLVSVKIGSVLTILNFVLQILIWIFFLLMVLLFKPTNQQTNKQTNKLRNEQTSKQANEQTTFKKGHHPDTFFLQIKIWRTKFRVVKYWAYFSLKLKQEIVLCSRTISIHYCESSVKPSQCCHWDWQHLPNIKCTTDNF